MNRKINILGISGSLRAGSSASAVLQAVSNLVPEQVNFTIYNGIGAIPAFDDGAEIPPPVTEFIKLVSEADGVFFCIPEYAFGVPGALKNAIDWTVATTAFPGKPVTLITAASSGDKAHAAFLLTLTALGTKIIRDDCLLISFIRSKLNDKNEIKDSTTLEAVKKTITAFIKNIHTNAE